MSVLTDPGWVVPPLPAGDGGGMDRLRRSVSRFAPGEVHAERRAAVERVLAAIPPAELRAAARALTLSDPSRPVVPRVPLTVLAAALGAADPAAVAILVPPVAAAYLPPSSGTAAPAGPAPGPSGTALTAPAPGPSGTAPAGPAPGPSGTAASAGPAAGPSGTAASAGPAPEPAGGVAALSAADAAADELVRRVGVAAATVLVQSCLPVTALVTGALDGGLDGALASATPPVPATRRWSPATGETITVPLAGIPFGEGPRRCPGEEHARALAAGILDALRAV